MITRKTGCCDLLLLRKGSKSTTLKRNWNFPQFHPLANKLYINIQKPPPPKKKTIFNWTSKDLKILKKIYLHFLVLGFDSSKMSGKRTSWS